MTRPVVGNSDTQASPLHYLDRSATGGRGDGRDDLPLHLARLARPTIDQRRQLDAGRRVLPAAIPRPLLHLFALQLGLAWSRHLIGRRTTASSTTRISERTASGMNREMAFSRCQKDEDEEIRGAEQSRPKSNMQTSLGSRLLGRRHE